MLDAAPNFWRFNSSPNCSCQCACLCSRLCLCSVHHPAPCVPAWCLYTTHFFGAVLMAAVHPFFTDLRNLAVATRLAARNAATAGKNAGTAPEFGDDQLHTRTSVSWRGGCVTVQCQRRGRAQLTAYRHERLVWKRR